MSLYESVMTTKNTFGWTVHDMIEAIDAFYVIPSNQPVNTALVNQIFLSAYEVIFSINERWPGVLIAYADEISKWCLWVICKEFDMPMIGYDPVDYDRAQKKYYRFRRDNQSILNRIHQTCLANKNE